MPQNQKVADVLAVDSRQQLGFSAGQRGSEKAGCVKISEKGKWNLTIGQAFEDVPFL
jgi:hypothetical protein